MRRFQCTKCDGIFFDWQNPKEGKHLRKVISDGIKTTVTCDAKPEDIKEIIECIMCGEDSTVTYVNPYSMRCRVCQTNEDYYEHELMRVHGVE